MYLDDLALNNLKGLICQKTYRNLFPGRFEALINRLCRFYMILKFSRLEPKNVLN